MRKWSRDEEGVLSALSPDLTSQLWSVDRSFIVLGRLKSYFRSIMMQTLLNSVLLCHIQVDELKKLGNIQFHVN